MCPIYILSFPLGVIQPPHTFTSIHCRPQVPSCLLLCYVGSAQAACFAISTYAHALSTSRLLGLTHWQLCGLSAEHAYTCGQDSGSGWVASQRRKLGTQHGLPSAASRQQSTAIGIPASTASLAQHQQSVTRSQPLSMCSHLSAVNGQLPVCHQVPSRHRQ